MYCTLFLFTKFVSGAGSFSFGERILVSIIDPAYFRHSKPSGLRGAVKGFKSTEGVFPESILAQDRPPPVPAEPMLTWALLKSNHCSLKLGYTLLLRELQEIQPSYTKKLNKCWLLCLVLCLRCFGYF